ncbi:CBS domain-containing protein CBSX1, chloroplastic [Cinnamomum micranthum f. kanehirae]|uniref:CBS domain-containing protein CBSX1, chloroplastic n=1 Tax=Cinnamomum micranthum f. kanehirae TaxID=337451 RepID=A0A443PE26_9MAGN|nr:CBS domain-containing protein CBSX1, chloroplastic [Cinnamomum micranthum f. kanehirae]
MACGSIASFQFLCLPPSTPKTPTKPFFSSTISISNNSSSLLFSPNSSSISNEKMRSLRVHASLDRVDLDENVEGIISGEWPDNFSLLTYDDLRAHLEPEVFKEKMKPSAVLGDIMSTLIRTATEDQTLEEIDHHFGVVSGLPVVDNGLICIGVVSKTDIQRASNGLKSKVGEVMSSPAITLSPKKTVLDAAALMLKKKIHRIPIVNNGGQVVGMVTRTDIFKALEGPPE